ncbi:MAG: nucleotidyltransferase domain-containing protein [Bacteroidota bacterium]|nr:nucleotidyltransferase domain-containing protein [Bacteroidota bacterium]MDE2646203.1 nucleotidyltransferase domain-containing protein [Bacteroidota bacterium]MXW14977.1 nucleotidyltransferase domain-containing protein [Rhodothermaceae bacterium]MYC05060.1 nucleotidyltransferase domain-containing protein [Rhodothermaceae bacterium]MYI16384.1 nucleotidyltransferase domain-containing protein [Rhodothermaceae bacterium]
MTDRLHLSSKHREELNALLNNFLPGVEVWAYGSRVNGRSHGGSDLDLVLRGPSLNKIPIERLVDFKEAVRNSRIPFIVEALDWARVPERFHAQIERHHVVIIPSRQGSQ